MNFYAATNRRARSNQAIDSKNIIMDPNLRQLQAFVHAYHLGSLTKTADRMHITQAAISVLIRQLEEALGVRLFDRTSRALKPTAAAQEALPMAERLLRDLEDLKAGARGMAERTRGQVRFGATAAAACTIMPPVIQAFRKRYPSIKLMMRDMSPDRLVASVIQEEVEFSIGTPDEQSGEVAFTTLLRDYLSIICRSDSPLASQKTVEWKDIKKYDIITVPRGNRIRALAEDAMAQIDEILDPAYEASFLSTALALTAQGLGVSVLPSYLVGSFPYPNLIAKRLTNPVMSRNLFLITKQGRSLSPAAESFVEMLKASIATTNKNGGPRAVKRLVR